MKRYFLLLILVLLSWGCLRATKQPEYKYKDITQFLQEYIESQNIEVIEVEDDEIIH